MECGTAARSPQISLGMFVRVVCLSEVVETNNLYRPSSGLPLVALVSLFDALRRRHIHQMLPCRSCCAPNRSTTFVLGLEHHHIGLQMPVRQCSFFYRMMVDMAAPRRTRLVVKPTRSLDAHWDCKPQHRRMNPVRVGDSTAVLEAASIDALPEAMSSDALLIATDADRLGCMVAVAVLLSHAARSFCVPPVAYLCDTYVSIV